MQTPTLNNDQVDEQYIIAGHWLSDLKFFVNEIAFFNKLLERNILFLEDEEFLNGLERLKRELNLLAAENQTLKVAVQNHREEIALEKRYDIGTEVADRDNRFDSLERRIAEQVKTYRSFKNRLFAEVTLITEKKEADEHATD